MQLCTWHELQQQSYCSSNHGRSSNDRNHDAPDDSGNKCNENSKGCVHQITILVGFGDSLRLISFVVG